MLYTQFHISNYSIRKKPSYLLEDLRQNSSAHQLLGVQMKAYRNAKPVLSYDRLLNYIENHLLKDALSISYELLSDESFPYQDEALPMLNHLSAQGPHSE